jgi:hypothetical protein
MSLYLYDDDDVGVPAGDRTLMMRYWDTEQCRFVVLPVPVEDWEIDAMHMEAGL